MTHTIDELKEIIIGVMHRETDYCDIKCEAIADHICAGIRTHTARNVVGDDYTHLANVQIPRCLDLVVKLFPPEDNDENEDAAQIWDALNEAAKALRAAGYVQSQWQPIETAPKDGTRILLTNSNFYGSDCTSIIDDYWYQDRVTGDFDNWSESFECKPTHWMPLPKPPEAVTKQTQENEG